MVCAAEAGKTLVSLTNVADECDHHQEPMVEQSSCCHNETVTENTEESTSPSDCCESSFVFKKLADQTIPQTEKSLAFPIATTEKSHLGIACVSLLLPEGEEANPINGPPPHQRKQSYLSFIQTFRI